MILRLQQASLKDMVVSPTPMGSGSVARWGLRIGISGEFLGIAGAAVPGPHSELLVPSKGSIYPSVALSGCLVS